MKKLSLFILLAAIIGLSSCATLRIDKRHYNGGWYVDFSNNDRPEAGVKHSDEQPQPAEPVQTEQGNEDVTIVTPTASDCYNCTQNPNEGSEGEVITISPTNDDEQSLSNSAAEQKQTPVAKHTKKDRTPSSVAADDQMILLVILAIFIPPLAVYLKQGVTPMFWITLICWLIGGAFLFGRFGYGYIGGLGLLAIVLALLVVFDKL